MFWLSKQNEAGDRYREECWLVDYTTQFKWKQLNCKNWVSYFECWCCLTLGISQVVRPLQTSSSAFSTACQGRMISVQRFESLPHGQADICLVGTLIGSSVFLQCFGFLAASYITVTLTSWDLIHALSPGLQNGSSDRRGDGIADIHRDLKVCERQMMEHLFAWGYWSFLPAQRFWSEYKASFCLFLRIQFQF